MVKRSRFIFFMTGASALIILSGLGGCRREKSTSTKPSEVINQVKENTLTTVKLTPEAEKRLGIETSPAELKKVPRTMKTGGEIIAPPGQELRITAPAAGMIIKAADGYFPAAGSIVSSGQEMMRLVILPPETDAISAREEVGVRQKEYDVALAEAERAEKLIENKAISDKAFEASRARLAKAEASLNAAKAKYSLFSGTDNDSVPMYLSTFSIVSPINGVIQHLNVTPRQIISSSETVFEVSSFSRFWIRVPVYSGTIKEINREAKAAVSTMGTVREEGQLMANPVKGPLTGNAATASAFLYYEINNRDGMLRNGQKVSVTLELKSDRKSLVVPYSSIIYDMYGGTWLYIKAGPQRYIRQRVELDHVAGNLAILNKGVDPGDEVVFKASAELYGTEFGGGK